MNKDYDRRNHIKPVIFGVEGLEATTEELELFNNNNPLGFIIFSRNVKDPAQLKKLVMQLKATVFPRNDVLILVDQEGGRVSRLNPPYWTELPPAGSYKEKIEIESINRTRKFVYNNYRLCSYELKKVGINVNCAPMVDLYHEDTDDIIGDRAFSDDPYEVTELSKEVCKAHLMGNVFPVIKHIPGHGRAKCDSHKELPVIDTKFEELDKTDFVPFKELKNMPFAMTAHIKYTDIDPKNPATTSKIVIDMIREHIGFKNILMTDDISMEALQGSMKERCEKSIKAGCDVILHCNGNFKEMLEICDSVDYWSKADRERYRACWKHLRH
jgi:beta-N-acetylhexosaminidase